MMDSRLLHAATSGDAATMKHMAAHDLAALLETTPQGNTCLQIATMHGHDRFCKDVVDLNRSLLSAVNNDGETPLVTAVTSGHTTLASFFARCSHDLQLSEAILMQDKLKNNALHHAIRSGHRELAVELIAVEPALTKALNQYNESPMFIAVTRNFEDVLEKLLEIPDSAHDGASSCNALHAAVRNGNSAIATKIFKKRPALVTEEDQYNNTPMHLAVLWGKNDVLRVLLEQDRSLGYVVSTVGCSLLNHAAYRGHVGVARELLEHCPDAPWWDKRGWTCLHDAVSNEQPEFVEFVLGSPQLRKVVHMRNLNGDTALHLAVAKCNPKMVAALLLHQDIDVTVTNNSGNAAIWSLSADAHRAKTLNWNEVAMRMLKADPQDAKTYIFNLHKYAKNRVTDLSRKDIRSLTQTYTGNTSLVAILIATITFAAAFTLPGGYSTDPENEGLPIMARKIAFKAFLVSDTLAMCSSIFIAFICVIAMNSV